MRIVLGFLALSALAQGPLDHTKWLLLRDGKVMRPSFALRFEAGKVQISGCNSQNGKYKAAVGKLDVGMLMSTRMACEADRMETGKALETLLATKPKFQIAGGRLTLTPASGEPMVFENEALPSKAALTKFIYVASAKKPCHGVMPMECFEVRDDKAQPWRLHYGEIKGFEFTPGIEYRLRIKEDKVAKPPADGSSMIWYLDLVVEQTVIERNP